MPVSAPVIVENDAGDRLQLVDGAWRPLANAKAPGATYLPRQSRGDLTKSDDAYLRAAKIQEDVAVSGANKGLATASRMERLLRKQETGGVYAIPGIGRAASWFDPELREMDAIQSEAARSKRQPGEGAISDFDAQQFLNMTYGRDKPTATNRALIQAQRAADDMVLQRRAFSDWYTSTYGTTSGVPEAWSRYAQDNPIFDPKSPEGALNGGRRQWREYFGAVRGEGDRRPGQAIDDIQRSGAKVAVRNQDGRAIAKEAGWFEKLPAPQRNAARMFSGSKAPTGTKNNPYVPASATEFGRLPPGAWYIDDDGKVYEKGGR